MAELRAAKARAEEIKALQQSIAAREERQKEIATAADQAVQATLRASDDTSVEDEDCPTKPDFLKRLEMEKRKADRDLEIERDKETNSGIFKSLPSVLPPVDFDSFMNARGLNGEGEPHSTDAAVKLTEVLRVASTGDDNQLALLVNSDAISKFCGTNKLHVPDHIVLYLLHLLCFSPVEFISVGCYKSLVSFFPSREQPLNLLTWTLSLRDIVDIFHKFGMPKVLLNKFRGIEAEEEKEVDGGEGEGEGEQGGADTKGVFPIHNYNRLVSFVLKCFRSNIHQIHKIEDLCELISLFIGALVDGSVFLDGNKTEDVVTELIERVIPESDWEAAVGLIINNLKALPIHKDPEAIIRFASAIHGERGNALRLKYCWERFKELNLSAAEYKVGMMLSHYYSSSWFTMIFFALRILYHHIRNFR
jgi:hypothetical protein